MATLTDEGHVELGRLHAVRWARTRVGRQRLGGLGGLQRVRSRLGPVSSKLLEELTHVVWLSGPHEEETMGVLWRHSEGAS